LNKNKDKRDSSVDDNSQDEGTTKKRHERRREEQNGRNRRLELFFSFSLSFSHFIAISGKRGPRPKKNMIETSLEQKVIRKWRMR
jgi:hypothetical protein